MISIRPILVFNLSPPCRNSLAFFPRSHHIYILLQLSSIQSKTTCVHKYCVQHITNEITSVLQIPSLIQTRQNLFVFTGSIYAHFSTASVGHGNLKRLIEQKREPQASLLNKQKIQFPSYQWIPLLLLSQT